MARKKKNLTPEEEKQVKLERLKKVYDLVDEELGLTVEELNSQLEPKKFIGRSNFQVEKFLSDVINPLLEKYKNLIGEKYELKV